MEANQSSDQSDDWNKILMLLVFGDTLLIVVNSKRSILNTTQTVYKVIESVRIYLVTRP